MNLPEWATAVRLQAEAAAARARELYGASAEVDIPPDYRDLIARIRLRLREIEYEAGALGHDVRNLQQVFRIDGLD